MKKIICLANSRKLDERCIAGIDLNTGKWVRPVCDDRYPERWSNSKIYSTC
ncbi:dual OB domain-containing protein [Coleofasciculus sp.]|uniref:dual OB domain-containing protein n=1 Tax=Coleofasciculus sp. TaxID=3100458 RepID=UPI0039F7FAF3